MQKDGTSFLDRIRPEVIALVMDIPAGRFTTYGTLARHLGINPRHVARILSHLEADESERLPWHRVVAAEGRISRSMPDDAQAEQRQRLGQEGLSIDDRGFIRDPDPHFHAPGYSSFPRFGK
ncbi:MAG TPA: MGMT family protein [Bacteroidia bacterium]|nr:MGMT family protein [Bacteroidia bacterium]